MFLYKITKLKITCPPKLWRRRKNSFRGVAALITVISIGSLISIISLSMAIISYLSAQNIKSAFDSTKAFYAAYSGLQDVQLKLERDKDYSSNNFNISINATDDVSVSVSNINGEAIATSTSGFSSVNKQLQTVFVIDTTTGLVTPTSTTELSL